MCKKNIITAALLVLLIVVTLALSVPLTVFADGSGGYDFTHGGSPSNTSKSALEVVKSYLAERDEALSSAEENFLSRFAEFEIAYSDVISTDKISLTYDEGASTLSVRAEDYSYTAGGKSLCYKPTEASFMGRSESFTDGTLTFAGVSPEQSTNAVTVSYKASVDISAEDMNMLLSLYRDTASYIYDLEQYELLSLAYEEYLHEKRLYEDAEARYEKYLKDLAEYERALYEYENYSEALEKYDVEYAKYLEYLALYEAYQLEYNEYLKTKDLTDVITNQLLALEIIKTPMTDNRPVLGVIMGSTVDSVLENKSLITSELVGVEEEVVDLAGDATERVRGHITKYFALATTEEKYNYYTVNYNDLCRDFRELTAALDKLYRNRKVRGMLIYEGKNRKYVILVAQLALITSALIDGEVTDYDGNVAFGANWKIDGMTRSEVLENKTYIVDNDNAKPLTEGLPPYLSAPVPPEVREEPTYPVRPQYPVKPEKVSSPGPVPRPMVNPLLPDASSFAKGAYFALSETERDELLRSFKNGEIPERERSSVGYSVPLFSSVSDSIANPRVSLSFYNEERDLIYSTEIAAGSAVSFEGALPSKETDSLYEYVFSGWQTDLGKNYSLLNCDESVSLYPYFEKKARTYTVKWNIGDESISTLCEAGTLPKPPKTPYLSDSGGFMYSFSGRYDKEITPVTKDTEYTAVFNKSYIVSADGGGGVISSEDGITTLDLFGYNDPSYDLSALISRIAGNTSLEVICTNARLSFSYSDVIKMKDAGACRLSVSVLKKGGGAYAYTVALLRSDGTSVPLKLDMKASLPSVFDEYRGAVLYRMKDGERKYASFELDGGKVIYYPEIGESYVFAVEYEVHGTKTALAEGYSDVKLARPGDRVYAGYKLADGTEFVSITVKDSSGNVIKIENDGYFVMPYSDVTVVAVASYKLYTVTFTSGGQTISSQIRKWGEIPVPPTPSRGSDGKYIYTFVGWSPKIASVSADATYEAIFEKTPVEKEPTPEGPILQDRVKRLLFAASVCVAVVLTVIIPSSVISVVLAVKRAKRKIKKKRRQKAS